MFIWFFCHYNNSLKTDVTDQRTCESVNDGYSLYWEKIWMLCPLSDTGGHDNDCLPAALQSLTTRWQYKPSACPPKTQHADICVTHIGFIHCSCYSEIRGSTSRSTTGAMNKASYSSSFRGAEWIYDRLFHNPVFHSYWLGFDFSKRSLAASNFSE